VRCDCFDHDVWDWVGFVAGLRCGFRVLKQTNTSLNWKQASTAGVVYFYLGSGEDCAMYGCCGWAGLFDVRDKHEEVKNMKVGFEIETGVDLSMNLNLN
jgi:hypothetical protein